MAVQLMDLPEELLLNILRNVQPEPPHPWGPTSNYLFYNPKKVYSCFQMSTLVSQKYRRLAVAIFDASYIYAVYMNYHMRRRKACTVETWLQREHRQVRRLHLQVDAYDFEDVSTFSLDVADYLGRYTALRELVITVETFEAQSTVAGSEAKIREAVVDWAQGARRRARLIIYGCGVMGPGGVVWRSHYSHGDASWQAKSARIVSRY
ncbi:hypothetical protein LTR97_000659 [Elasticomyces elasticus]|uniref:F-box domain-containing protein n=1 Tax=Elasticomyces elasticus TaxID=574655 RepID=A0AAN8A5Z3_9PEZI|nr:hypothetical protein LTR97_000659 [Elasticomyces elasticus]